jgi:hypothetical protein
LTVAEFGMFEPPDKQNYFSIGTRLFAGNAALYGFDARGETVNFALISLPVRFYESHCEVEAAIVAGAIERPCMRVNDTVFWQWPSRAPEGLFG